MDTLGLSYVGIFFQKKTYKDFFFAHLKNVFDFSIIYPMESVEAFFERRF